MCPHWGGGLFVLMAARDWRDCWALFTLDMCQAGEFSLGARGADLYDCNRATGAVRLTSDGPDINVAREEQACLVSPFRREKD